MNDLKMFSNSEFGELGVMTVEGREYFPATQCAKILGYAKPADAIRKHCKGVSKIETPTAGGTQQVNYIPEGDLYRLIVSSKLPAAEKFERWVFDEVLPSIRKTGGYGGVNIEQIIAQTATAVVSEDMKLLFPELAAHKKEAELKFLLAISQTNGEGIRRAVIFYRNAYNSSGGNVTIDELASLAVTAHARIPNLSSILKRITNECSRNGA